MTEMAIILIENKLKRAITETERNALMDYFTYYGVDDSEYTEYADSFVDECFHKDDETGKWELNQPDGLPFASETHKDNRHEYSWGGCTITKFK